MRILWFAGWGRGSQVLSKSLAQIRQDTFPWGTRAPDWSRVRQVVGAHHDALAQAFQETFTGASKRQVHAARDALVARQLHVLLTMMEELPVEVERSTKLAWPTAQPEQWSVLSTKLCEELAWWQQALASVSEEAI